MEKRKSDWTIRTVQYVDEFVVFDREVTKEEAISLYYGGAFDDCIDLQFQGLIDIRGAY